jgi:hypothetical protein
LPEVVGAEGISGVYAAVERYAAAHRWEIVKMNRKRGLVEAIDGRRRWIIQVDPDRVKVSQALETGVTVSTEYCFVAPLGAQDALEEEAA